jgi:hypothetical protein
LVDGPHFPDVEIIGIFGKSQDMRNVIDQIINAATLAPSSHNTQPWKFVIESDRIHIYPDYERALNVVDPDHHELFISLGCAVENLEIAARKFGYRTNIHIREEDDVSIIIEVDPAYHKEESILYDQIEVRQTTRNRYNGISIPIRHLMMLHAIEMEEGTKCYIINNRHDFEKYTSLVKEACILQFSQQEYVSELVKWIRFNRLRATKTNDGLYCGAAGKPDLPEWFGKFIVGLTIDPVKESRKCEALINSSSALIVFTAAGDDKKSWINVGRSFERFALTASYLNINLAHQNSACEVMSVRKKLAEVMDLNNGEQPLMLSRIGYSDKMPYSYRRPLEDVLVEENLYKELI